MDKKEVSHVTQLLENVKSALKEKDSIHLKDLSDQTTHESCKTQDSGSITLAVIIYTLSKLIERKDYKRIKTWDTFVKKFSGLLDLTKKALQEKNQMAYESHLLKARRSIESLSVNLKPYIKEVMRKSCINKASNIYEHGISLGQTSRLLGISQWEITEFTGQKTIKVPRTLSIKKRAEMAMEFFQ